MQLARFHKKGKGLNMEEICLLLDSLPPREYSPNWRGHWSERHKAGRAYGLWVFYQCVDWRNRKLAEGNWKPFERAWLSLTFVYATHRRRDVDNLIAMFKPGLDGIVRANLLIDDDITRLGIDGVKVLVDKETAPKTIIKLRGE